MVTYETFAKFGLPGNAATYQEIVDDARIATDAIRVQLMSFDSSTLQIRQMAWSDSQLNAAQAALARVQQFSPFFDPNKVTLRADVNEWNEAVYLEGRSVMALVEELAEGVVDPRIVQLAKVVAGMRIGFIAPLRVQGKVVGALTFLFSETPSEGTTRTAEAFVRLASLTLDNLYLGAQAEQGRTSLSSIVNTLSEGVIGIRPDGTVAVCNRRALEILGLDERDLQRRSASEVVEKISAKLGGPEHEECYRKLIAGEIPLPYVFDTVVLSSRREITVTAYAIPMVGSAAPMLGLLFRDVTDERELERRRGAFFEIASHELRTPMTSIMGFSEILVHREASPATMREWASYILRQSQKMTGILDQMLNASQIQSGQIFVREESVSLSEAVEMAVTSSTAITSRHRFVSQIDDGLPLAKGDRYKVIQVLTNLLDNAVKYSPEGGTITVAARLDGVRRQLVVSVSDEGLGISAEDQRSLFTPFYRVSNPATDGIGGMGLGLYISNNLVHLMGGETWLESTPGQGSTFYFSLPVWPAAARARNVGTLYSSC